MTYIFGAFLIFTAAKMLFKGEDEQFNPKKSFIFRNMRKIIPVTMHMEGQKFFIKKRHITFATPLFVALIVIELMDVLFAMDSVPAILAITSDPFLVFSSNIFAICFNWLAGSEYPDGAGYDYGAADDNCFAN